ncbi:DUF1643 domain-containing protein [Mammaliicoccus vitulinus]|uniref:DUF1643 domain-containing protein n=1 Tax=Mammaliicoccus vitulinus TaxID=71237 RepID=UPI00248AC6F0|nr:DUF1643 domain-containing protein [Mammaliicoccus vitulinus]
MYKKMAEINGLDMQTGVGQALFDNVDNPTKRYFLEKRWDKGNKILGAIMMNPSKAGNVESDKTVNRLIDYAKGKGYSAIYVINVSPHIESASSKLNKVNGENYDKDIQTKCFKFVVEKSTSIYLGWGSKGHPFFKRLVKNNGIIKNLFSKHLNKFEGVINSNKKYPTHPSPRNADGLNEQTNLNKISSDVKEWLK